MTDYTVDEEDVTVHQEALQLTEDQITDLQDYLTEESDPVFAASPAATGLAGGHTHSVELTTSSGRSHTHSANTSLSGMTKPMRLPANSYRSTGYTSGTHSSIGLGNNQSYTYNPGASTTISSAGTHVHDFREILTMHQIILIPLP